MIRRSQKIAPSLAALFLVPGLAAEPAHAARFETGNALGAGDCTRAFGGNLIGLQPVALDTTRLGFLDETSITDTSPIHCVPAVIANTATFDRPRNNDPLSVAASNQGITAAASFIDASVELFSIDRPSALIANPSAEETSEGATGGYGPMIGFIALIVLGLFTLFMGLARPRGRSAAAQAK